MFFTLVDNSAPKAAPDVYTIAGQGNQECRATFDCQYRIWKRHADVDGD